MSARLVNAAMFVLGLAGAVAGQQGTAYFPVRSYTTHPAGFTPWVVEVGDLNGDGRLDAAVATESDYSISLLLAQPGGGFGPATIHAVGIKPRALAFGDLDGNGAVDVVVGCLGNLVVLLGDGAGGVLQTISLVPGIDAGSLAVADLDADGHVDIVGADSGAVSVLHYAGGVFLPPQVVAVEASVRDMAVADVNADGFLDVVLATDVGLQVMAGNASATLGPPQAAGPVLGSTAVALGDVNGDGHLDAVVTLSLAGVSVQLGDGTGRFVSASSTLLPYAATEVALADFDFDQQLDVVSASRDFVGVQRGDGAGSLGSPSVASLPMPMYEVSLAVADGDADGRLDALALARFGAVLVLPGDGLGHLLSMASLPAPVELTSAPTAPVIAELTGDGHLDLVHGLASQSVVQVRAGDGHGALGAPLDLPLPAGDFAVAILAADLNEDGVTDLAVARRNVTSGKLRIFLGSGGGGFLPGADLAGNLLINGIAVADMNADGHADLVAAAVSGCQVYLGNGLGAFTGSTYVATQAADSLAVADFDADGHADVALSFGGTSTPAKIYWGDGQGTFESQSFLPQGSGAGIAAVDADEDGLPDLVSVNGPIKLFVNLGARAFAPPVTFPLGAYGSDLQAVTDFDRDGHADLLLASNSETLSVLRGDGEGSFGTALRFGAWDDLDAFAVGDMDEDGRPDVVTASAKGLSSVWQSARIAVMPSRASSVGPWTDLGLGLAGSHGVPQLTGVGSLAPLSPVSLAISGARPFGLATLVIGGVAIDAPFKGGTFVPLPTLLIPGLPLDADGAFAGSGTWYGGLPSGVSTWFQAWLPDPAAVAGFSATNGLRGVTP